MTLSLRESANRLRMRLDDQSVPLSDRHRMVPEFEATVSNLSVHIGRCLRAGASWSDIGWV